MKLSRLTVFAALLLFSPCVFAQQEGSSYSVNALSVYSIGARTSFTDPSGIYNLLPVDRALNQVNLDLNAIPQTTFFTGLSNTGFSYRRSLGGNLSLRTDSYADVLWSNSSSAHFIPKKIGATLDVDLDSCAVRITAGHGIHPLAAFCPDTFVEGGMALFNAYGYAPVVGGRYMEGPLYIEFDMLGQSLYPSYGYNQYANVVPSTSYLETAGCPELFVGVGYKFSEELTAHFGADFLTIRPRLKGYYPLTDVMVFVKDRVYTFSAFGAVQYNTRLYGKSTCFKAKTHLNFGQNHATMFGGYAITGYTSDLNTRLYSPYATLSSWVSAFWGEETDLRLSASLGWIHNAGCIGDLMGKGGLLFYESKGNMREAFKLLSSAQWSWGNFKLGADLGFALVVYGSMDDASFETGLAGSPYLVGNAFLQIHSVWNFL